MLKKEEKSTTKLERLGAKDYLTGGPKNYITNANKTHLFIELPNSKIAKLGSYHQFS